MTGKYLLDTNVVIALFAEESAVEDRFRGAEGVFVPSVVLGELYFGACKSHRVDQNMARIDEFALQSAILNCDAGTARVYGQIKNRLRQKGRPIPENDLWIAAVALQHGLTVAARDTHFAEVEGLQVESW